jgi:Zn-dependent protease with chaperone function
VTEERFGRLVRRIEASAQRGYANYLRRTWLLGWFGVALPFALIALAFGLVAILIPLLPPGARVALAKALILLLVPLCLLAKSYVVRWPSPAGVRLEPADFPALFALLERLRAAQGAIAPSAVFLDGSFNAAVAHQPRSGLWGRRRVHLTLGLPLMDSLSPEQFAAVLAHEFGHVAGAMGATSTQIYAMRLTMEKLATRADGDLLARAVGPFYRRFVRYFDAYSCVATRGVEIKADRAAAAHVGNETFASALVAVNVQDQRIDRDFWQPLEAGMDAAPIPPSDVYDRIAEIAMAPLADAGPLLRRALAVPSQSADTHPSLAERLRALDVAPDAALAPLAAGALRSTGSAAAAFLGAGRSLVSAELGARWAAEHAGTWTTSRRERRSRRERLAALDARAGDLTREEERERVRLAYGVARDDVEALARALLAADPNDAVAQFYLGCVLADREDPAALTWLDLAFASEADAVVPAANRAIELLLTLGRVAEAECFADRTVARLVALDGDRARRASCSPGERFVPHASSDEFVAAVVAVLRSYESIDAAWLARRTIASLDSAPAFVLVVERRRGRYEIDDSAFSATLRDELSDRGDFFVATSSGRDAAFRNALTRVADSSIYAKR